MDEETKKIFAYILHQIHELSAGQARIEKSLEHLATQEKIYATDLGEVTRKKLDTLFDQLKTLLGEEHDIIRLLKNTNRY